MFVFAKLFSSKAKRTKKNISTKTHKTGKLKVLAVIVAIAIAVGTPVILYFTLFAGAVRSVVTIEAGEPMPDATIFARHSDTVASYITDVSGITLNKTGDISLKLLVDNEEYDVILRVVDTVAPVGVPVILYIALSESPRAKDFVTDIYDKTDVTVSFETPPDFKEYGKKEITILLNDEGGNTTKKDTFVYIFGIIPTISIEAGTNINNIDMQAFLAPHDDLKEVYDKVTVSFDEASLPNNFNKTSDYTIRVFLNETSFPVKVTIIDTTAPTGTAVPLETWLGWTHQPLDFIENAHDFSDFSASFPAQPDFNREGTQDVTIILEDIWGNKSEFKTTLTIKKDTIPPEIIGTKDLTAARGANILYRTGVTAVDNADGDIDFEVDSSAVNIDVLGEYPVIYSAVDSSGNETSVTITVTIVEFTPESINESLDVILAQIIKEDMDDTEKARAIHRWVRSSISYGTNTERDIYRAAYRGLQRRTGDCFTYFAVSTLMLDRVDIKNVEIRRTPGARSTNHYWSLIEIDGLWYHFDSTPNIFGVLGFMLTSPEATAVSENSRSRNYYTFDPALYPPIAGAPAGTPSLFP